jgi:hypothetical protein
VPIASKITTAWGDPLSFIRPLRAKPRAMMLCRTQSVMFMPRLAPADAWNEATVSTVFSAKEPVTEIPVA